MSLEETKQLLRSFRIVPNKLLGQSFMIEPAIYPKLCEYAQLNQMDVVLDVGAGFGFLTRFLSDKCKAVVAVEKDPQVAMVLREQVKPYANVQVLEGDALKIQLPLFDKVVAIPPYYLSSRLVLWLFEQRIKCSMLILQREFAEKLLAPIGSDEYSWLSVVTFHEAKVELFDIVPKDLFFPQPEVDSIIIRFTCWETSPFTVKNRVFFFALVRWLFTQRNKKISNAILPFLKNTCKLSKEKAVELASQVPFGDRRPRELSPKEFGELADAVTL
jgi:16S rRNA (adenine1518-N6/adenine1519-N6)-dimethyltransferase